MNKLFKIILSVLIVVFGAGFLFVLPTSANGDNLVVQWSETGSGDWQLLDGPIFSETNFMPGKGVTRFIRVTNNSGQTQRIAAEAINKNDNNNLSSAMDLVIKQGMVVIFNNTLRKFFNQGETYLSSLANGAQTIYELTITFNSGANDDYQNRNLDFDILIGFEGTEGGLPLPLPGEGTSTYSGGELPAGLTIQYEAPQYIGSSSAKIVWTTTYKSTSRVIYDLVPGVFLLSVLPNYGYAYSTPEQNTPANPNGVTYHEIWLTGLTPETTYYYRCISHASPDTIGREFRFTTLSFFEKKSTDSLDKKESVGSKSAGQEVALLNDRGSSGEIKKGSSEALLENYGDIQEKNAKEIALGEQPAKEKSGSNPTNLLASIGSFLKSVNYYWFLILFLIILFTLFFTSRKRKKKA